MVEEEKPKYLIYVEGEILPSDSEQIEDSIAEYLAEWNLKGKVESNVTGNTTTIKSAYMQGETIYDELREDYYYVGTTRYLERKDKVYKKGDVVLAVWYDDPTTYKGEVQEYEEGLYIQLPDERVGYIHDAFTLKKAQ
jgi:hypothetical protein